MTHEMNAMTLQILKHCNKVLEDPKIYAKSDQREAALDGVESLIKYYDVTKGKPGWLVRMIESFGSGWPVVLAIGVICIILGLTVLPWAIGIAKIFGYA